LGFTHFQPAQLTTVGKRACLWNYDLIMDLQEIELRRDGMKFRGAKGTTGTQASFLALFQGDHDKVRALDKLVASKAGFADVYTVTGQTYTRKVDSMVLNALAGLGQSLHKWGTDLRLLAHRQEIDEPFEEKQVGSSAMAYKRNPMRAERMCGLARYLMHLPTMAADTVATQWFERTLDDSAPRRLYIPQAFLAADACLKLALNLASGLAVNRSVIRRGVEHYLPYMATENLMMAAVARGANRQDVHEIVRQHSHTVTAGVKEGTKTTNDLISALSADYAFAGLDIASELRPARYIGRAPEQVDEFITQEVQTIRERYQAKLGQKGEVNL
jgi:adenylosuccinate lyase